MTLGTQGVQVQGFYLRSGPGCFAQEFEAGLDARFVPKTIDVDTRCEALPLVTLKQMLQDGLQGLAMQGIVGLWFHTYMYCLIRHKASASIRNVSSRFGATSRCNKSHTRLKSPSPLICIIRQPFCVSPICTRFQTQLISNLCNENHAIPHSGQSPACCGFSARVPASGAQRAI